jgi:hypothetical protein
MRSDARNSEIARDVAVIACLLLLVLAMFGDLLLDRDRIVSHPSGDVFRFFLPYRAFGYRELAAGNLPLWNPHLFSGTPFVGAFQSAMFYPPNLIHLLVPTATAVDVEIVFSVFILGALTYAWARGRRLDPVSAGVAATLLMFSGPFALRVMMGQLTLLAALAWTPLLLLAVDRIVERPSLGWCLGGILAGTMQILAGYPGAVLTEVVAAAAYVGLGFLRARSPARVVATIAVVIAAPLLLAAVQLFPGMETAAESARAGGGSFEQATQYSFPPENLLTLFSPAFFGDLIHLPYWGRALFGTASLFLGVGGLALAIVGVTRGGRYERWHLAAPAVLLIVLALGHHTPLYRLLYTWVPGFALIRSPSKFLFFPAMLIAMLAGHGAQRVRRGEGDRAVVALFVVVAVALGAAALLLSSWGATGAPPSLPALLGFSHSDREQFFWLDADLNADALRLAARSLRIAAFSALVTALLLWRAPRSRGARLMLLGLAVAEIAVFAHLYRGSFDVSSRARATVDALYASLGPDLRVFDLGGGPNARIYNRCMDVGGATIWGYDPVVLRRYAELIGSTQPEHVDAWLRTTLFPPRVYHPLFGMLRCAAIVRSSIVDRPPGRPGAALRPPASNQLRLALDQDEIERVSDALPHFLFVGDYRVVAGADAALDALLDRGFDPRRTVLLEEEPGVRPDGRAVTGRVTVLDRSTDHLALDIALDHDAILVITDSFSIGWRAIALTRDPPQTYRLLPANHALQALPLRAGHHRVMLEYAPVGFRIGAWVSSLAAALYLGAVAWWWRGRRRAVRPCSIPSTH